MKDTALYEQLLGLKTAWSVKKVDLSLADQRALAEVVLKKGGRGRTQRAPPREPTSMAGVSASGVTWTHASSRPLSKPVYRNSNTTTARLKS